MIVLAFHNDPEVVGKILRHLGLPCSASVLSPARSPRPALGFALLDEDCISNAREADGGRDLVAAEPVIRPPPREALEESAAGFAFPNASRDDNRQGPSDGWRGDAFPGTAIQPENAGRWLASPATSGGTHPSDHPWGPGQRAETKSKLGDTRSQCFRVGVATGRGGEVPCRNQSRGGVAGRSRRSSPAASCARIARLPAGRPIARSDALYRELCRAPPLRRCHRAFGRRMIESRSMTRGGDRP